MKTGLVRPEFRRLIRYVQYGWGRGEVAFEIFHNLDARADLASQFREKAVIAKDRMEKDLGLFLFLSNNGHCQSSVTRPSFHQERTALG